VAAPRRGHRASGVGSVIPFVQAHIVALPPLAKFALGMALIVAIPRLCRRIALPDVVGFLLVGVVVGPHVLGVFPQEHPIAEFFADLGKLLLMFFTGVEIDLALFRKKRARAIAFGVLTTGIPLVLGACAASWLGYPVVPAIVIGSLLASHALLGMQVVTALGVGRLEPIVVTVGATVLSDTLSLVVFALCVPTFVGGFSISTLLVQTLEIVVFVPAVLLVLSRFGAQLLARLEHEDDAYFVVLLLILAASAILAEAVDLPGIVGAFLAGLAVNATVHDKPTANVLHFFARALFIPIFFCVTGFLIDPMAFMRTLVDAPQGVVAILSALFVGKWLAAELCGRAFGYSPVVRLTVWSLTLPQVAATLAAALVAYHTRDAAGHRLLDQTMLNVVLVMMLTTAVLGPILTQYFAARLASAESRGASE
jgi:Kef-type K+ transport system membrane component KefB